MKKVLLLISVLLSINSFAQMIPGNIVVVRVGDSTAALSGTSSAFALEQYTTLGAYVNTTYLPRTGTSSVSLAGSATSEGFLTLATNQSAITMFAYKAPAGTAAVAGSASATNNRQVISVNAAGTVSYPTLTATTYSAGNPRCVITNGTTYWASGSNTGVCAGTATSNIDTVVSSSSTNIRCINIFNGQLFYSTASGTTGIWKVGIGTPTGSGNVSTVFFPAASGTSPSPYGFAFNNDTTICYIADDRTIANGGGIQRWTKSGGVWSLAYTLNTGTGSTVGARGLVVNWNTYRPTIIATTAEPNANRIIRVIDSSSSVTTVTLATAGTNTAFRGVTFAPGTSPLPIQFTSAEAIKVNTGVLVKWSTASEINNAQFEIERSNDGEHFTTLGIVKGNGNSNVMRNYEFTDAAPLKGANYYRIRQVDYDGSASYSSLMLVEYNGNISMITSPNPFNSEISVNIDATYRATVQLELFDVIGKLHYSETKNLEAGHNHFDLNTAALPTGVYFVKVSNNGEVSTQKIIKK